MTLLGAGRNETLSELDRRHVIHGFSELGRIARDGAKVMVAGDGVRVVDEFGKSYIEAASGMWCANFGFSDADLAKAASDQLAQLPYYHTLAGKAVAPSALLAEKLAAIAPLEDAHVYFALSGSEANDYIVKLIWFANNARGLPQKKKIITRKNGYHGVTIAATHLTGVEANRTLFDMPMQERFVQVSDMQWFTNAAPGETREAFADRLVRELEEAILREGPDTIAAMLVEPVTAGGGVALPPTDYYQRVAKILKAYDIVLIADEVVTGFGRTGRMFACETFGIAPDAMVIGKGLTGAYQPLGAVLLSGALTNGIAKAADLAGWFGHGATYAGYPVGCAVGLRAIELIEQRELLAHVRAMGDVLMAALKRLERYPVVAEVRGVGLMAAVQFAADRETRRGFDEPGRFAARVQAEAEEAGVIVRKITSGDAIAFAPPLIIKADEIEDAVRRFEIGLQRAIEVFGLSRQATA